jgi:SAM-dependent methyltransferase
VHADLAHVRWAQGRGEDLPYAGAAFDVVLCIGVLHHVPDPLRVLREIVRVLRPGGLLYFYMYYAMEQRSAAYRALHAASSWLRRLVHPLPAALRLPVCDLLAVIIYLPLVLTTRLLKRMGVPFWRRMPLAYYHDKSFRVMRNDALDRFGTPFEARSTQDEIVRLLADAGFTDVRFSDGPPYWHGTAKRPME